MSYLYDANLKDAYLSGAVFGCYEGKIQCTNLKKAENLTSEQVKQAKDWQQACYDLEFRKKLGLPLQNPNCAGEEPAK
jgi:hypothetical protein